VVWPGLMEIDEQVLAAKFEALLPHLDERGRRLVHAVAARSATGSTGWAASQSMSATGIPSG